MCVNHPREDASAFCANHKVLVCLNCIITRKHFEHDCDMIEMKNVTGDLQRCLKTREAVRMATEKLSGSYLEEKLERQIDDECDREIARIQNLKRKLHAEMRKNLDDIRTESRASHAESLKLIDEVFVLLRSNRRAEADALIKTLRSKRICQDVAFRIPAQVRNSTDCFEKIDMSLYEYLDVKEPMTHDMFPSTGVYTAKPRGRYAMSSDQVPGRYRRDNTESESD